MKIQLDRYKNKIKTRYWSLPPCNYVKSSNNVSIFLWYDILGFRNSDLYVLSYQADRDQKKEEEEDKKTTSSGGKEHKGTAILIAAKNGISEMVDKILKCYWKIKFILSKKYT